MGATNTGVATRYARNMPLLTELGWNEDGLCYRHGAPNGAFPKPSPPIPPKTARNQMAATGVFPPPAVRRGHSQHPR